MTSSPLRAAALSAAAFAALAGLSRLAVSQDGAAPAPAPPGVGLLDLADASTMSGMPYPEHVKPQAHYQRSIDSYARPYWGMGFGVGGFGGFW